MDIQVWPDTLNPAPLRDGYKYQDGETRSRTEMEQGTRDRPVLPYAPAEVELTWIFPIAKFDIFRTWYRYALEDGAKWFRMDVWTGNQMVDSLCLFLDAYDPRLSGGEWTVNARLAARPYVIAGA